MTDQAAEDQRLRFGASRRHRANAQNLSGAAGPRDYTETGTFQLWR